MDFHTSTERLVRLLETNDPHLTFLMLGKLPALRPHLTRVYSHFSTKTVAGCVQSFFENCTSADKTKLANQLHTYHGIKNTHFCEIWPGNAFFGLLNTNTTLKYLVVINCLLFNTALQDVDIEDFKIHNNTLQLLHVSEIHPTPSHWGKHLGAIFAGASALTTLVFRNIQIYEENMTEIGDALAANTTLTHLTLARCRLTDLGFVHIARALRANTSLIHLDLSSNTDVTSRGIVALAEALIYNNTLRSLLLNQLPYDHRSHLALKIGCTYNPSLVAMNVSQIYTSDSPEYRTFFDLSVRNMLNTEKRDTTFTELLVGGPRPPSTRSRLE